MGGIFYPMPSMDSPLVRQKIEVEIHRIHRMNCELVKNQKEETKND